MNSIIKDLNIDFKYFISVIYFDITSSSNSFLQSKYITEIKYLKSMFKSLIILLTIMLFLFLFWSNVMGGNRENL